MAPPAVRSIVGLAVLLAKMVSSAHILMATLGGTKSHKVTFLALGQGLISAGHEVTLVSPFRPSAGGDSPVKEVVPKEAEQFVTKFTNVDMLGYRLRGANPYSLLDVFKYSYKVCEAFYSSEETKQLLKQKVDLLILDGFYPECMLGLAHHYHAHVVLLNTIAFATHQLSLTGSPTMYSVTPFVSTSYSDRMDFWERSKNLYWHLAGLAVHTYMNKVLLEPIVRRHLGSDVPSNNEIARNISMVFQNGHHSVTLPRPFLPNVIDVGCMQCRKPQPLPKDLEAFVAGGKQKGFIFVSFGTSVQTSQFPEDLRLMMIESFRALPYQVVWKYDWNGRDIPDLPKNVKTWKWLPQQDLLGHPKMLAFVSHGGLNGLLEAAFHGVPLILLPVFCDQGINSRKAGDDGYAAVLDIQEVTADNLTAAINRVVVDHTFKENAQHRSTLLRDQPHSPLDIAVYWTGYVLRHQGALHLQSAAVHLSVVEYLMLDTLTALAVVSLAVLTVLVTVCRAAAKKKKKTNKLKSN